MSYFTTFFQNNNKVKYFIFVFKLKVLFLGIYLYKGISKYSLSKGGSSVVKQIYFFVVVILIEHKLQKALRENT